MTRHQPKPVDFISLLSSEDEAPLTRKRKYSEEEAASVGGKRATKRRAKRARASSVSGDSVTRAKSFKEAKLEEDEGSDTGVPGFARHGEKKKVEKFTANTVFMPKSPPIFTIHPISLHLPVFAPQREGTWLTRFTEWAQLLCTANTNSPGAAEITPALIRAAYKQYIDIHSRLKSNKKRAARLVAQQFKDSSLLDIIRAFRPLQNEAAKLTDAAEEALEEALEETLADSTTRFDAPQPPALPPQTQILSAAAAPPSLLTEQSGALYIIDVSPQLPQTATTHETIPVPQPELLPALSRKPLRQTQHSSLKITMSSQSAIPSGAEALEQQRRYFPSATDPSNMCLLCGQEGHIAGKCTRSCRFCGEKGHWDYNCPSWSVRCADCWRSGHTQENCRYPNEPFWLVCGYCRAPEDHERWQCMTLFRSFRPGPDTIKKVNALPVSCAACGSEKHFHGDCRKDGAPNLPYHSKFHLDNMRQYLDPTSSSGPIIGTDACRPATKVGGFRISSRALASPVDNVQYYSGSDDSDDGLCVVAAPIPVRRYNCEPPPPCLQSPSSANHQSPPSRDTSPSLGSLSSRVHSPYRQSWVKPYRPPTPPPPPSPSRRGGGRRSGRGGRGGRGGGQATQNVQSNQEEDVQGGQHVQSGQGEQNGQGGRRGRGKWGKRGDQTGQVGQGHQGGPAVHNVQGDQGGQNGPGEQQNGHEKGGNRQRRRRGQNSQDGHQGGLNGQVAQDGQADQAGQAGQAAAGEQNNQGKRNKRRGRRGQNDQNGQCENPGEQLPQGWDDPPSGSVEQTSQGSNGQVGSGEQASPGKRGKRRGRGRRGRPSPQIESAW